MPSYLDHIHEYPVLCTPGTVSITLFCHRNLISVLMSLYCIFVCLGHLSHVQMLIEAGCDITRVDQSEEMAIHKATRGGHNPVVMFLLANGSDVNSMNKEGK